MIKRYINSEINEIIKKVVKTQSNQNNGKSNMACRRFKFVCLLLIID